MNVVDGDTSAIKIIEAYCVTSSSSLTRTQNNRDSALFHTFFAYEKNRIRLEAFSLILDTRMQIILFPFQRCIVD